MSQLIDTANFGVFEDLRPRSDLTNVICPEQSVARGSVSAAMRKDEAVAYFSFRVRVAIPGLPSALWDDLSREIPQWWMAHQPICAAA
ncbi:hypothetical protein ACSVBT_19785 [Afipia sp. TerB]